MNLTHRKFNPTVSIIKALSDDYPRIQNMARFYVYDLSRACTTHHWARMPEDGLYECFDFKNYFEEPTRKAFLVKVYDEIAGFVLLNQATKDSANNWNMGEFFIIAKFQDQGIASRVAKEIWNMHPGKWEVSVIPNNKSALKFWEKSISEFTYGVFNKQIKEVTYDEQAPRRIIFEFDTKNSIRKNIVPQFVVRTSQLSDIDGMVLLSKAKRKLYEKAQPQFWRYAGEEGDKTQEKWFKELLEDENHVMLVAVRHSKNSEAIEENNTGSPRHFVARDDEQGGTCNNEEMLGFIIGRIMPAPEVYNPGGLTLMIDDFCITPKLQASEGGWQSVGAGLIEETKAAAKARGAKQILVVCGAHDYPKRKFLREQGLSVATEWFVGGIL